MFFSLSWSVSCDDLYEISLYRGKNLSLVHNMSGARFLPYFSLHSVKKAIGKMHQEEETKRERYLKIPNIKCTHVVNVFYGSWAILMPLFMFFLLTGNVWMRHCWFSIRKVQK